MKLSFLVLSVLLVNSLGAAEQPADSDTYFPQQMTARDLLMTCASSSLTNTGRGRQRYCHGFVSGVEEGIRIYGLQRAEGATRIICLPPGTTSRQLTDVYVRYASAPQVELEEPAASIVMAALMKAFPC